MQQLTCNIDLSCSFYYLLFSFVLIELKPFDLKGKVLGEKCEKNVKISEPILPFSCCPLLGIANGGVPGRGFSNS